MRDAADDGTEGKGSVLTELLDLAVRSTLAEREDLRKLQEDVKQRFEALMKPEQLPELAKLESGLAETLKTFAPGTKLELIWHTTPEIDLPMPSVSVQLVEDGYAATVEQTGHGLRRAFILTMLQHLAMAGIPAQETGSDAEAGDGNVAANGDQVTGRSLPAPTASASRCRARFCLTDRRDGCAGGWPRRLLTARSCSDRLSPNQTTLV